MNEFSKAEEIKQMEGVHSNRLLKFLLKCQLCLAILSIPFNIVLWIVAPDSGTRGTVLGMIAGLIGTLFLGCFLLSQIKKIGNKLRILKIILGLCVFVFFFFGVIGMQVQISRDLFEGMEKRNGILEYYKDEGKVSRKNSNHDYIIKISTFDEELTITRSESFGAELEKYLNKEIQVNFYKRIKKVEDIFVQGSQNE